MTSELHDLIIRRTELEEALERIQEDIDKAQREADYYSADQARKLLKDFNDPNTIIAPIVHDLDRILKTLVFLRPEPDSVNDYYLTWDTPVPEGHTTPVHQFSVSLERHNAEVYLNDDHDQVAHSLTPDQAELLGRRLLGAAEAGRRLQEEI